MTVKQGEHTPGPWTAFELGAEDGTWSKWSIVANGPIAYGGDNGKGSENSRANALLMAGAPTLLAACKAALEAYRNENYDDYFDGERLESMLEQAIEAAQGEQV